MTWCREAGETSSHTLPVRVPVLRYKLRGEVLPPVRRWRLLLSGRVFWDPAAGTTSEPWNSDHIRAKGEGHRPRPASSPPLCCHSDSGCGLSGRLPARLHELRVHRPAPRVLGGRVGGAERVCAHQRQQLPGSYRVPYHLWERGRPLPAGLTNRSEQLITRNTRRFIIALRQ